MVPQVSVYFVGLIFSVADALAVLAVERRSANPRLTASYSRVALTQKLRRIVDESVGYGLVLEVSPLPM